MLSAVLVVAGAVSAWLLIDHLLSLRERRLQRGRAAWLEVSANRTFHSTGWEETLPPLEAAEAPLAALRQRAKGRSAA